MFVFNHIAPEQLGNIRAVRINDSEQRDRQTISEAGHVLAEIAMPAIRKVTCEFRITGRCREDLMLELQRLSTWLYRSGEAELELRNLPGQYVLARCTGLSEPEFTGLLARVTATFTCRDPRTYQQYNHRPKEGQEAPFGGFSFNGIHSSDMHTLFVLDRKTGIPAMEATRIHIPGRPGTLRYAEMLMPGEREVAGTLYFLSDHPDGQPLTYEESEQKLKEIAAWLVSPGRAELIWDYDTDCIWQAEIIEALDFDRKGWQSGKLRLAFCVQPIAYGQEQKVEKTLRLTAGRESVLDLSEMFPIQPTFETPIDIRIAGQIQGVEIHYPAVSGSGYIRVAGPWNQVKINGEDHMAYADGTEANRYVTGDFPVIQPGDMRISFLSDVNADWSIEVTARARWI